MNKKLTIRAALTGEKIHDINSVTDDYPSCLCGADKTILVVFKHDTALIYQVEDGSLQFSVECAGDIVFAFPGIAVGSTNYAVVTTSDQIYFTVLNLKTKQFSPMFRGFEPFMDEDIGEEIQYEIDELVITSDEKQVVYSNVYSNDIVFLDFINKKKTKIIKGNPNDYMRSLKQSNDGKSLYFVKGANVYFSDIKSSNTSQELKHPVDVIAARTNNMKIVVTSAEDSNVRVWDRTKAVQNTTSSSSSFAHKIRLMKTLPNSRYIVAFGFKTSDLASQILFVYDVFKHITLRERSLDCSILHMDVLNDKELLIVHDVVQKLKIIDLDTMKVTKEFQGYLSSKKPTFTVIKQRNEVACLSFGRHNIKLYSLHTGKVSAVLQTNQQEKLDGLCVSQNCQTLAAWCDNASLVFIFDVPQRKLLHAIQSELTLMLEEDQLALSFDGKFVIFKVEGVTTKSKKDNELVYIQVWDTQKGKKVSDLRDAEYQNKYMRASERSELTTSADTFVVLNDNQVLVAHDDFILRVFDIKTGKLLHRLHGHITGVEIVYVPHSPYILTFGSWTEEMSLRLWDKQDFSCVASFTLDEMITNLQYSSDSKFILATIGKPAEIVSWKLYHAGQDRVSKEYDYPVVFQGTDTKGDLDLVPEEEELTIDPNDLDKDMEVQSSDEDDEFL